jgi:hypothetical protein
MPVVGLALRQLRAFAQKAKARPVRLREQEREQEWEPEQTECQSKGPPVAPDGKRQQPAVDRRIGEPGRWMIRERWDLVPSARRIAPQATDAALADDAADR